ncbi:MAG: patatin-like phospholipase family protein [Vicinamibacteria bacterium]
MSSRKPLVLALSGGGAHAAAHAGVILELAAQGVTSTGYAGVSGGALVAAAYLGGASMEALVEEASRLHPWFWVRGWGGGLLSGTKLGVLIDEFLPKERFAELSAPLAVLATDMDTGQGVVFKTGNVRDAVRASCSFPGVFPPFILDGRRLYDGGVTDVVPVKLARELAGDEGIVIAVDVNGGTKWPAAESFVAIALRAGLTLLRSRTRVELSGADLVIAPAMGDSGWMQPRKIPTFFEAGRAAARAALPEILRLIEP